MNHYTLSKTRFQLLRVYNERNAPRCDKVQRGVCWSEVRLSESAILHISFPNKGEDFTQTLRDLGEEVGLLEVILDLLHRERRFGVWLWHMSSILNEKRPATQSVTGRVVV